MGCHTSGVLCDCLLDSVQLIIGVAGVLNLLVKHGSFRRLLAETVLLFRRGPLSSSAFECAGCGGNVRTLMEAGTSRGNN